MIIYKVDYTTYSMRTSYIKQTDAVYTDAV